MKIDHTSLKPPAIAPKGPPATKAAATGVAPEAVTLSAAAGAHKESAPPVSSAKIQEIKDAIAQGRFSINPEAIADGLIDSARALLNSQRRA